MGRDAARIARRQGQAVKGNLEAMREHLFSCLHDVLWPLPTTISFEFKDCTEVRLEFVVPGLDIVPDREAAMASGNRVSIRRMQEVIHVRLHNQHALGLVVRLIGELFSALPTVQLARCAPCRAWLRRWFFPALSTTIPYAASFRPSARPRRAHRSTICARTGRPVCQYGHHRTDSRPASAPSLRP